MAEEGGRQTGPIQGFILERELAEVYLLLDHISAAQTKTMPATLPDEQVFGTPAMQANKGWVEQICEIAWPPSASTPQQDARNAAKLIRAKDLLNLHAYPATGATVAFTVMMTGEADGEISLPWWRRLSRFLSGRGRPQLAGVGWPGGRAPSRGGLAVRAYPNLAQSAAFYRAGLSLLLAFLVLWLLMTCFLSWDVATGSALLNRYNSLDARIAELKSGTLRPGEAAPDEDDASARPLAAPEPSPSEEASATPAATEAAPDDPDANAAAAEPSGTPTPTPIATPIAEPTPAPAAVRAEQSDVEKAIEQQQAAATNLRRWLDSDTGLRGFLIWVMGGGHWDADKGGVVGDASRSNLHVEWAAVALGILAASVLPIFYGLLGAGAAVVRIVSAKMRDNTLAPRDILLAYVRLALGAVIGACIGLFVTPDGSVDSGQAGLLGPVHLSASALCFIAGFGVEGVFQAIEAMMQRLFNLETARTPTPGSSPAPGPGPQG
jgi:cell division septation protein DedD